MPRSANWKETAELVGIFAILVSLIFVALQLRQEKELLLLELRNNMIMSTSEINAAIIENADIWRRGNLDEKLDDTELEIYKRLLINYNDWHFNTALVFEETLPGAQEHVLAMFAGFLSRNPGAYRIWIDRERELNADRTALNPTETITTDWIDAIDSRIAIIQSSSTH